MLQKWCKCLYFSFVPEALVGEKSKTPSRDCGCRLRPRGMSKVFVQSAGEKVTKMASMNCSEVRSLGKRDDYLTQTRHSSLPISHSLAMYRLQKKNIAAVV